MLKRLIKQAPIVIIFILFSALYYKIFEVYFFGDDFFHFELVAYRNSFRDVINFFGFHPFDQRDIAFYRPIFRELLYFSFYNLFGLNHVPFRVLQFLIHFANIYLVYVLSNRIFQKRFISLTAAAIFGLSAANVGALYYLAGGIQAQGATFFVLLTVILFDKYKTLSFLTFLLSISSHEMAIVSIPILIAFIFFRKGKVKDLWPNLVVGVIYLLLNRYVIGFSQDELQYRPTIGFGSIINGFGWYLLWSLGLPEMLIDFVGPGFSLNPNLLRYWGSYYKVIFIAFLACAVVLLFIVVRLLVKKHREVINRETLLLAFWFFLGLAPVVILPWHKSTYYLQIVLPAFSMLLALLMYKLYQYSKTMLTLFLIAFITLNVTTVLISDKTFWAAQRGRISQKIIDEIKSSYPMLPRSSVIYFKNDSAYPFISEEWGGTSKQYFYILSGSDALQLLYNDPTISVYYEDIETPPEDLDGQLVAITAKI